MSLIGIKFCVKLAKLFARNFANNFATVQRCGVVLGNVTDNAERYTRTVGKQFKTTQITGRPSALADDVCVARSNG